MTDRQAFLNALTENEDDQATRLIFADWLDDHDEPEEADRQRAWPAAKKWLQAYAQRVSPYDVKDGLAYSRFLEQARDGTIFYHGTDCWGLSDVEDADELFRNLGILLGHPVDGSDMSYSCSC